MALTKQSKAQWELAQEAEKGHWAWLWQADDSQDRKALINSEVIKGEFIFEEMIDHFGVDPSHDWAKLSLLDVGCGPLSLIARHKYGQSRTGVDPLRYPRWVYDDYAKNDFTVLKQPFEELTTKQKFDVIIFYNALQHFADLTMVAAKCKEVLSKSGAVYLSEYLNVPTNEAHIQYLETKPMDKLFTGAGFKVESKELSVRLPGYVERPDGAPIGLYVARLKLA